MNKTFSLLLLTLSLATAALAKPTAIKGVAIDGSKGSQPLANATVQLVRPGEGGKNTTVGTTKTNAKGAFAFPAKEYSKTDLLIAVVNQGGFDYISVAYDGGDTLKQVGINVDPQKVDLLVFDTSTKPVPLDFQVHHLAIEATATGLHVIERIVVQNHSDLTFLGVGPRKITILLDVPKAAKNVKLDPKIAEAKMFQTSEGWGISKAITPDSYGVSNALIFSYDVDWNASKSVDLSRKTIYPTKFFFVARTTADKGLKVTAPKLSADNEAPVPIDGQTQTRIINSIGAPMADGTAGAPALPAGQEVAVNVSGAGFTKAAAAPTADAPAPLELEVHHLAISSTATGLHCIERLVVGNNTGETYEGVGKNKISVLLDIPAGAKNVKMDPKIKGAKIMQVEDVWGIAKPIPPGSSLQTNALIFSYDLDWPSMLPWAKKVDLSRKTIYPTKFFFVARTTDDKGLSVEAPKLSPDSEQMLPIDGKDETRIVNTIGAPPMASAGEPPAVLTGQVIAINVSRPVSSTFWGFAGMTVALCLFLPIAMLKPRRGKAKTGSSGNFSEPSYGALVSEQTYAPGAVFPALNGFGTDLALSEASRDLIQKIADLDDEREAGQIGEEEYQSRRAAWKKQLIESLGTAQGH